MNLLLPRELKIWLIFNTQHPTPCLRQRGVAPAPSTAGWDGPAVAAGTHRPSYGTIRGYLALLPWDKSIYRIRKAQTAVFGLCMHLHEEDSNFSFLELYVPSEVTGEHIFKKYMDLGCTGIWYHERIVGTPPFESTEVHQWFHHLGV